MIAKAICKYRLFYSLTSKQFTPLFRCFSAANEDLFRPFLLILSRYSSAHNWKMIGMRRGMLGKNSRQNQTEYRGNSFSNNSLTDSVVTSSTVPVESMPFEEEIVVPPVTKRAKIDTEMPTTVAMIEEQTPAEKPPTLRFKKISNEAKAPSRGTEFAAGFDLYSAYEYTIPAGGKEKVLTDISIELPEGCYGRVAPRSGLAWKNHIDVGAGVIDRDYRGNIGVILFNLGKENFKVEKEMRIAQLICERICYPELEEVDELEETKRGSGGYGSTGTN